jgi:hypothetical protein
MAKKFSHKRSHKNAPKLTATAIVLPSDQAKDVRGGNATLHARPVKPTDHFKRFHEGRDLHVRSSIGGASMCRVVLTHVERRPAGTLDFADAVAAGFKTTEDHLRAWVERYDARWVREIREDNPNLHEDVLDAAILARFEERWADRPAWVLRFERNRVRAPRMLAAKVADGYTESDAMSANGELPALYEDEHERHIVRNAAMKAEQWMALERATRQRELEKLSLAQRLEKALSHAEATGQAVPRDIRVLEKRLEAIERGLYEPRRAA